MIGSFHEYLLRIISAAFLCAVVKSFGAKSSVSVTMIKTLCGVFLTITILSPIMHVDLSSFTNYVQSFSYESEDVVYTGSQLYSESLRSSIKQQAEAYILDKAASIKADLSVEVILSNDDPPTPLSVVLDGQVSPYAKSKLTKIISDDLGISKENQTWI